MIKVFLSLRLEPHFGLWKLYLPDFPHGSFGQYFFTIQRSLIEQHLHKIHESAAVVYCTVKRIDAPFFIVKSGGLHPQRAKKFFRCEPVECFFSGCLQHFCRNGNAHPPI